MATGHNAKKEGQDNIVSDYLDEHHRLELRAAENNIREARNAIFFVAAITLIGNVVIMALSKTWDTAEFMITLALAGIFAGLGFLTKKAPLVSIIIALCLFIGNWILNIIVIGPDQIYSGLLPRAFIAYFLIKGVKHARDAERLRREMNIR